MPAAKLPADTFVARTALFYGVSCVLIGINMPFFPVWLAATGLDAGQVGLVLAVPAFVRIIAVPAFARVADHWQALRGTLIGSSILAAFAYLGVGLCEGLAAIIAMVALAAVFNSPNMSLLDAYALRGLKARGGAYGPVRLWGSATFIAANLGAGLLFNVIDARDLIWLIAAAAAAIAVSSFVLVPLHAAPAAPAARPGKQLWRDPAFVTVLIAASLIQAAHAVYYGFSTIHWAAAGLGGGTIGALWGLGVVAEIILFALSGRLPPAFTPPMLIVVGAAGSVVRWTAMAFDPPLALLPLLQCLHALSFGATHLGTVAYVAQATPHHLGATGQAYFSVTLGIAMGAAMMLSGALYAAWGSYAYAAMAIVALAGGAMALAVHRRTAKADV
jgi:PPP family 3-phenylpropionic acid transporter